MPLLRPLATPRCPLTPPHRPLTPPHCHLTPSRRPLGSLGRRLASLPFNASHCLLTSLCPFLMLLNLPVSLSYHCLTPLYHPFMISRRLISSL